MAYGDEKRPSGIVDTRIKPEGPQFPPRPSGFTYSKEIEKEIKKRLPAMPYVPTRADEALDESPEAKAFVFTPPKVMVSDIPPSIPRESGVVMTWQAQRRIEDLHETIDGRSRIPPDKLTRTNLLREYKTFFALPNIREALYTLLRDRNPTMRFKPTRWEMVTGSWPMDNLSVETLTRTFLERPYTPDNLWAFDMLYEFLVRERPDLFIGVSYEEPETKSGPLPPYRF